MSRISHANSIDRQISELKLSTSPPTTTKTINKTSNLASRRKKGSPLRINTTKPSSSSTNNVVATITTPAKKNTEASLLDARTGKPFSVKNLDTGETINIEEIDKLISQDSLTTFRTPYAKDGPNGKSSSPFANIYDRHEVELMTSLEENTSQAEFMKNMRLCDSPKKVQPSDYFNKIGGNFGVKIIGNSLVRDERDAIYTVYVLDVRHDQYDLASKCWTIYRRYREFYALDECLRSKGYKTPSFPPKKILGTFDPEFVAKRQRLLASWLENLLNLPALGKQSHQKGPSLNPRHSETLRYFISKGANVKPAGLEETNSEHTSFNDANQFKNGSTGSSSATAIVGARVTLDDFHLIKVIGKGSFAKVVLVRQKKTEKLYAMKILKKDHIVKRKQVEHTNTERAVLRFTRHPFIVQLHYAFQTSDRLFFVLDYCSGGELFFHLGKAGEFRESVARYYTAELVLALSHLHSKGVIYRDLKPENVLLDADGHVKIADFGLSKVLNDKLLKKGQQIQRVVDIEQAQTFSFCGTPEYLAPEILTRSGHGASVDWWSLGMLLYEMLTGLPPWYTKDRRELFRRIQSAPLVFPSHVSSRATSIIRGFLERNVKKRLGSKKQNGVEGIKNHEFFDGLDWDRLFQRKVRTPFAPKRSQLGEADVSNFDKTFTRLPFGSVAADVRRGETTSSSSRKKDQFHKFFKNFSYEGSPSKLSE
eukprot:g7934.t1